LNNKTSNTVAIIGAGPAGLMAAETLIAQSVDVHVYDAMPSVGRKFLMAGIGGMNITHAEPAAQFITRYGDRKNQIAPMLEQLNAASLRDWVHQLGFETFVGSSGRVFPIDMKAAPLLRAWLHRLRHAGVHFHVRHQWQGWDAQQNLCFHTPQGAYFTKPDAVILALGGGSWANWVLMENGYHYSRNKASKWQPLSPPTAALTLAGVTTFKHVLLAHRLKPLPSNMQTSMMSHMKNLAKSWSRLTVLKVA